MENNLNKQETQAIGKYIRLSVQKTRRVLDQIRGKKYQADGLPTTRMIIPFSNHKKTLAPKISSTVFNQYCLIISTVKKVVLFDQY